MKYGILSALIACLVTTSAWSADFRIEPLDEGPPADALQGAIGETLDNSGFRVIRGTKTTYCDLWLCKHWETRVDFEPTPEIMYPFRPGQLIGVARFARKGADFRDQDISKGVYTIRYAQQPVDGAHVGTSLTRDFLLLVRAEDDSNAAPTSEGDLNERSAVAAESSHPCLLSMQRVESKKYPAARHHEETDWWIVAVPGKAGDKKLPIAFVVSGVAVE